LRHVTKYGGTGALNDSAATLRDYLRVLRRRKWVILLALVVVPATAVVLSLRQDPVYEASADVLLSQQNLATALAGAPEQAGNASPDRQAQTQANLARIPEIARRTLDAVGLRNASTAYLLTQSSVEAQPNADMLTVAVRNEDRALAARLAGEYARQYTLFRRKLDTASIESARKEVESRIEALRAEGGRSSALYASLVDKEQQLKTMEALETANANVVRTPESAAQIAPRPRRNALLGLVLGLGLGLGLAFLRETLDTRMRSVEQIGEAVALPLLGRIPAPERRLRRERKLVMLEDALGPQAEAIRMLRTNIDFSNLERGAKTIMVTSAVEEEGKSTTVANLAVAAARSGKRVVVVDLDLRRPFVAKLFGLEDGAPGVTDVALGEIALDEALVRVPIADQPETPRRRRGKTQAQPAAALKAVMHVLPAGASPPNAGEFVGTRALGEILDELSFTADLVLIDAPPLLHVGDAMTLTARVDAAILVTRVNVVRRDMLGEVRRLIDASRADWLGYVATGVEEDDDYRYGYGQGYGYHSSYLRRRTTHEQPVGA
jgi:succinoglycan biosynthesis transport protein ExoP